MTIPYLPGWWDEINAGGAASNLFKQLPGLIQPDNVANKKLQEAIQQNPQLLEQISNMDPSQRNLLAAGFGFKKQNPFGNVAEGAKLKDQNETAAAVAALTPEQKAQRAASKAGVSTQEDLIRKRVLQGREDKTFDQTTNLNDLNIQILNGKVKDMKDLDKTIDAAKVKYPTLSNINMRQLAKNAVRGTGTPMDNQLMTAIQADPGANEIFNLAKTAELKAYENELSIRLARQKDPNTNMLYLRTLMEIGNQYNDQEARLTQQKKLAMDELSKDMRFTLGTLPNAKKEDQAVASMLYEQKIKPIDTMIQSIQSGASDTRSRLQDALNKMDGGKKPDPATFMQQWTAQNPRMPKETDEAYAARGKAAYNALR